MLYKYARNSEVGYAAGWNAHTSIEDSIEIIKSILSLPETYEIVLNELEYHIGYST